MCKLTIASKFYRNPGMLELHYKQWSRYPQHLKKQIEIVLVDDGSPCDAAKAVPRPEGLPDFSLYRILIDKPTSHDFKIIARNQARYIVQNHRVQTNATVYTTIHS